MQWHAIDYLYSGMQSTTCTLKLFFCPHCSKDISRTEYYKHKRLYFSRKTGCWNKRNVCSVDISGPSFSLELDTRDAPRIVGAHSSSVDSFSLLDGEQNQLPAENQGKFLCL